MKKAFFLLAFLLLSQITLAVPQFPLVVQGRIFYDEYAGVAVKITKLSNNNQAIVYTRDDGYFQYDLAVLGTYVEGDKYSVIVGENQQIIQYNEDIYDFNVNFGTVREIVTTTTLPSTTTTTIKCTKEDCKTTICPTCPSCPGCSCELPEECEKCKTDWAGYIIALIFGVGGAYGTVYITKNKKGKVSVKVTKRGV